MLLLSGKSKCVYSKKEEDTKWIRKKFYMTTAIAYTSGKPHIGNTYEFVLADAIARYKRSQGYDVFFQTGTDEHGQKIELKAQEAGVTPKEFVDGVAAQVKEIADLMNTSYDKFIRTQMNIMRNKFRKSLKSCMSREIFTKDIMKECTVHRVRHSLQNHNWLMENVRTVDARFSRQRKRHISSK